MSNKIILFISFYFFNSAAFAFPLTTYIGDTPDRHFLKLYYERLEKVYKQELGPIKPAFTPFEIDYISECKKSWSKIGVSEHPLQLFEYFSFRYKVTNGAPPEGYVFIGTENKTKILSELIDSILKNRGISLTQKEKETFFGFVWSATNTSFSTVHLLKSSEALPEKSPLRQIFLDHVPDTWSSQRLYIKTKNKDGTIQSSLHIPLKNRKHGIFPQLPLDIVSATKIITDTKDISWHYRLKSLPPFLVKDSVHPLIDMYNQNFNLYPHSIIYQDTNNFTLHYP